MKPNRRLGLLFVILHMPSLFLMVFLVQEGFKHLGLKGLYLSALAILGYVLVTLYLYNNWQNRMVKKVLKNNVLYKAMLEIDQRETVSLKAASVSENRVFKLGNARVFYEQAFLQSEKDILYLKETLEERSKAIRDMKAKQVALAQQLKIIQSLHMGVFDSINDPVVIIDDQSLIVNQNKAFKERYQTDLGDVIPELSEKPWSFVSEGKRVLVYVEKEETFRTLEEKIGQKKEELNLIAMTNESLISGKPIEPLTDQMLETIDGLFGLKFAGFHVKNKKNKWVRKTFKDRPFLDQYDTRFDPFESVGEEWMKHPKITFFTRRDSDVKTLVLSPLEIDGEKVGIMSLWLKSHLDDQSKQLIKIFNNQLTIVVQRAVIFEALRNQYFNTIEALVNVIEAKDKYTEGHSRRVSRFAVEIAKKMGYSNESIENIEISGLLHDVGKIGIQQSILTKQGKLTAEEYEEMKRHPEKAIQILDAIDLDGNIMEGILYHHLRYDLSGYPKVKLDRLPPFAAIIGAADAFDAITSVRSYSDKATIEEAIFELKRCSGSQFDPQVVEVFEQVAIEAPDRIQAIINDYGMTKRDIKGDYHVISGTI